MNSVYLIRQLIYKVSHSHIWVELRYFSTAFHFENGIKLNLTKESCEEISAKSGGCFKKQV